jgi:hypothetical protein
LQTYLADTGHPPEMGAIQPNKLFRERYMSLPSDVEKWIEDFCLGKTYVEVGHMMFSVKENLRSQTLEESLYLIREHKLVREYINDDSKRCEEVAQFVASTINDRIISTFKSAVYHGD